MGKISSIYNIGKNYVKSLFTRSVKSAEQPVSIMAKEEQNVNSKQIEAYYARYQKHLTRKTKDIKPSESFIAQEENSLLKEMQKFDYETANFVSKDTLNYLSKNFEDKKQKVLKILEENIDVVPPYMLKIAKNANSPEKLVQIVRTYISGSGTYFGTKYMQDAIQVLKTQKISLNFQKELYADGTKMIETYIKLVKALTKPTIDPRVIKIENYLKSMYGMEYVHLENIEEARKILQTINIIKKTKIPLPDNIIVTPFVQANTKGMNVCGLKSKTTVFIKSASEEESVTKNALEKLSEEGKKIANELLQDSKNWMSTTHPLHLYVHEFAHTGQYLKRLLVYEMKKDFLKLKMKYPGISEYATSANRMEFENELVTKDILAKLNEEEKSILNTYF